MPSITRLSISFVLFAMLLSACSGGDAKGVIATNAANAEQAINRPRNGAEERLADQEQGDAGNVGEAESVIATNAANTQQKINQLGNAGLGSGAAQDQDDAASSGAEGEGNTPQATDTAQPTDSTEPTERPTISSPTESNIDWTGIWQFWVGALSFADASIAQSGDLINGSFSFEAVTVSFSGSLSADQRMATGSWENTDDGNVGSFQWQIMPGNPDQFVGNLDGEAFGWCGARNAAAQPSPCLWPETLSQ